MQLSHAHGSLMVGQDDVVNHVFLGAFKLPKDVDEMTEEELDDWAGQVADAMIANAKKAGITAAPTKVSEPARSPDSRGRKRKTLPPSHQ